MHVLFRLFILGPILAIFCTLPASARQLEGTLTHRGVQRSYIVTLPDGPARTALPLVIVLHGGGGNAGNAMRMTGFGDKALAEGFAAVFPDGSGRLSGRLLTWNAGACCSYAARTKADDAGFLMALTEQLQRLYDIDPKRIYVTGMSNGGMMAQRLARDFPGRIAAVAPVVGGLFGDEAAPRAPVPALILNGALDERVRPDGGDLPSQRRQPDARPVKPALYQGHYWAKANGCAATPAIQGPTPSQPLTTWRWQCPAGREVVQIMVMDQGHAWPGGQKGMRRGDAPSPSLNATDLIWDFFSAHRR